jgi:hypothetical protein
MSSSSEYYVLHGLTSNTPKLPILLCHGLYHNSWFVWTPDLQFRLTTSSPGLPEVGKAEVGVGKAVKGESGAWVGVASGEPVKTIRLSIIDKQRICQRDMNFLTSFEHAVTPSYCDLNSHDLMRGTAHDHPGVTPILMRGTAHDHPGVTHPFKWGVQLMTTQRLHPFKWGSWPPRGYTHSNEGYSTSPPRGYTHSNEGATHRLYPGYSSGYTHSNESRSQPPSTDVIIGHALIMG